MKMYVSLKYIHLKKELKIQLKIENYPNEVLPHIGNKCYNQ